MKSVEVCITRQGNKIDRNVELVVFMEGDISSIRERDPEGHISFARKYAAREGVFLVPGLYIRDGYLCSCIIDKNGRVLGEQRGTHLNMDFFSDLRRASGINIIETPVGPVFLCVDVDIYKPEVLRIAALSGAETVICSQYIAPKDYSEEMILAGPWQEAQQNSLFILNSTNHGGNIIGPCNVTDDLTGYLARGNENVYSILDFEKRSMAMKSFPVFNNLNIELYSKHKIELCK